MTKTFTAADSALERHATLFRALSDPRRLRILELLRLGEQCVCDLQTALDCGQSLLSFHLKTLRDAGLVTMRKEGRWSHYTLAPDAFVHAEHAVAAYRAPVASSRRLEISCCA
ncbi:MAG: helix-turn-helix transcriptional regulator [Gemmatimonadaceae bacterium]|nr:helix-turn-helix transcriptional regulator [Gemmatimonadaceae bacterium]MCW5825278.1 helix-turn-helix transcriptional regulator [Gemmatimonadaceae bacterium]